MSSTEENQLTQSVDGKPQVRILYPDPNFVVPIQIASMKRLNPIIVKFGSHVTPSEAKCTIFIDQNTETIPVPKVFMSYSYGPIHRDIILVDLSPVTDPILESHRTKRRYQIIFTHSDLRHWNIIVNDKYTSEIWRNDWTDYLVQTLDPYYPEFGAHSFLTETLWC
ncbi:uncharacterized protein BDW43DRAFT_298976 [Aspergillus alliaceus]|uniref:uncharacterized protein n=1 Tax=Petromyces alliaceus TaxID=209559 RepID=UPI0012A3DB94|nr:uncharacterized protein BDW43DRAFT_298976 [Aspergillus alliaceus]KAB8235474.1 hypothetical protein BDW43DRAFT_298976 [Aspergillus alliaceus]